ncbi:gfo/Idh/MocA family oxidoreductase [Campylobacter sp. MIT 99-7217]|uniref:Gfo/Idh/MocA family protein n=1 Tax=Campylobacter sp. MIT 99-7217 TaxID=535091 RepID=UPI001159FB77|nr:Gfo/Idh/MocA family oxidoreductase [Campylobacter sp. MIT 99-7217]TQR33028.1 gfo/Idh/MocA family oxidoreductase [Campylobacter sp. MIT 99-7217]
MRIGLIGLGRMGKNHLNELSKNENFKEILLYDIAKSQDFAYPFYENLDEFLEQNLDLLIIASPTNTHFDLAKKAFSKVKNILIEKPLALNLTQMKELDELSKTLQINVGVGFSERFNPVIKALKQALKDEKIISINIQRYSSYPQRITDVGVLQDLAVHDLDLLAFLSQSEFKQSKVFKGFAHSQQREDDSIIACELENCIGVVHESWNASYKKRQISVICEDNSYEANLNDFILLKNLNPLEFNDKTSPLRAEHEAFLSFAKNDFSPLARIKDAIRVQELLEDMR